MGSSKESKYKVRCYYEVLEVERNADEEDIRQAYRKLARKWHPDKNLDNPEEADLRFKEIQNAYGVLSDPNERAWYDSHREQILMGGDPTDGSFEGLNVWEYFNSDCYDDFDDSEEGFYTVYRKVFDTLAAEEEKFDEDHKTKAADIPSFGKKNSDAKEVNAFYNFWLRFSSQKSFSWKDVYRTSDAPNREVRRVIEKENKKERDKARKAFNDLMRKFVEFVRKKDPRITQMLKAERLRKKQEEEQRAAQRAEQKRIHEENRAAYQKESAAIMDSIQFDEADHEMLGIKTKPKKSAKQQTDDAEGNPDDAAPEFDDEDEDVEQQLYCMACRKKFKSDKQYQNHENSKKHKENVAILKAEVMLDDEIEQFLQDQHDLDEQLHQIQEEQDNTDAAEEKDSAQPDDNDTDMNDPAMLEMLAKLKVAHISESTPAPSEQAKSDAGQPHQAHKEEEKQKKGSDNEDKEEEAEDEEDGDEDFFLQAMMAKTQQKSKKQQKKAKKASARNAFSVLMDDVADYEDHLESLKAKSSDDDEDEDEEETKVSETPKAKANDTDSDDDDDEEEENAQKKSPAPAVATKNSPASSSQSASSSNQSSPASGGAKKQQQKKRRRKAKGGAAEEPEAPKPEEFKCRVCQGVYATRNELFQHLKDSKHASAK